MAESNNDIAYPWLPKKEVTDFTSEYEKKIKDNIDSEEFKALLDISMDFRKSYIEIYNNTTTTEESFNALAELVSQTAKKIDPKLIQVLVDKPWMFHSFYVSRARSERAVELPESNTSNIRRPYNTGDDEFESGRLFKSLLISFLSKDLSPTAREDFIDETSGLNIIRSGGNTSVGFHEPIFDREVTEDSNIRQIQVNARAFRDAIQLGRKAQVEKISDRELAIIASGQFYAMVGNQFMSLSGQIIDNDRDGQLGIFQIDERVDELEENLPGVAYKASRGGSYQQDLKDAIFNLKRYYIKRGGLSEEEAQAKIDSLIKGS